MRPSILARAGLVLALLAAQAAADLPEARRVLTLAGGDKVRVVCRLAGDEWQYKNARGWQSVPARMVVEAVDEGELLKAWRAEQKLAKPGDLNARLGLARWAAERGLALEALAELDAVLLERPDDATARSILAAHRLLSLPEGDDEAARRELLRLGPTLPAAGREAVVLRLQSLSAREQLETALVRDLESPVVLRRVFAMHALRRLRPGGELRAAALHAMFDASSDARREAAWMLAAARDAGVTGPFTKALLESRHSLVRERAAEALGRMGYAAAVPALVARLAAPASGGSAGRPPHAHVFFGTQRAYVQDFDVEVAQFSAVADPVVNTAVEGAVLDVAVVSNLEVRASEPAAVRGALRRLVGERHDTSREWLAWWEQQGKARWSGVGTGRDE